MSNTWMSPNGKLGDAISLVAGLALAVLPFAVSMTQIAFWSALLTGGLIAVLAAVALWRPHEGLDWARMVAGVWAAISPWALAAGFTLGSPWRMWPLACWVWPSLPGGAGRTAAATLP